MEQRLAVARVLARQALDRRGDPITDDAIDREAAIIARGLYVERPEEEIALTVQALIESCAEPRSSEPPLRERDRSPEQG